MKSDIPEFNDRCRLVLLQNKPHKSFLERQSIKRLTHRYSNYKIYNKAVIAQLLKEGYLDEFGHKEAIQDPETGHWIPADGTGKWGNPEDIYYITRKEGEIALSNGYFESEYSEKVFKTKFVRVGVIIGAISGFISLCLTIYNLFKK